LAAVGGHFGPKRGNDEEWANKAAGTTKAKSRKAQSQKKRETPALPCQLLFLPKRPENIGGEKNTGKKQGRVQRKGRSNDACLKLDWQVRKRKKGAMTFGARNTILVLAARYRKRKCTRKI